MYRLLGPHVNHTHGGIPEFVAAWQPPVAVILDPTDAWAWVPSATPRTRFVWRWWLDDQNIDFNQPLNPAQAARDHLARIWRRLQPWMTGYVQGTNETVIGSAEAMARYADFEARCKHCGFRMVLDTGSRAYDMARYHFITKCPHGPSQSGPTTKSARKI